MRKVLVGVVVCSAVAAGFFFWGRSDELPPAAPGSGSTSRATLSAKDSLVTGELKTGTGRESLSGHVFDAAGAVAGATLVAVRVDEEEALGALECDSACGTKTVECDSSEATERVSEWVKARRGEAPPVARTTSAPDGTFELAGLEPGLHRVWSFSDGRGVAVSEKARAGTTGVEVNFAPAPVAGKVVDGKGKPLAGLWVTAFLPDMPRYFDAQTGQDGTFTFGSLPPSQVSLVALGAGGASAHLHLSDATGRYGRSPRNKLTLVLAAPFEQAVRVLAEGKPAPGALVTRFEGVHHREWTTNAAGEVKVTLTPGARAWLSASLGTLGGRADLPRANQPRAKPMVIELAAMDWTSGEVRTEEGRPLEGASVAASGLLVLTDEAGRYRIGPLLGGARSGYFTASAKGYVSSTHRPSPTAELKTDFTLVREARLSGRVLAPDGLPLEGADVSASQPEGEFPRFSEHLPSGADGTFSLEGMKQGPCTLTATHPVWGTVQREVSAPDSAIELRLEPGAELGVTFVDDANRPLQLTVMLMSDEPMSRGKGVEPPEPRSGQTDRLGRVQFKGLGAGKYVLVPSDDAEKRSSSTLELTDREHQELRVVLEEGLRIEGQVLDADGRPVAEVSVDARPEKTGPVLGGVRPSAMLAQLGGRASAETDAQGRFQLRHLGPGNHRVVTHSPSGNAELTAEAGATGIELRVPAQLLASGRVVDEQRAPVTQFRAGDEEIDSASGDFRVQLKNGVRVLYVAAEGYPTRRVELTGEPVGHVIDVGTIVLLAPRAVKVTVLDAQTSRPIAGATVMPGSRFAERAAPLLTNAEGVATVDGLGGDEAGVSVQAEGYLHQQVLVPPGLKEQVVALARGARLAGRVLALDGGPGHADLRLSSADGGAAFGRVDESGQYEVTAAPGAWEVHADFGFNHLKQPPGQVTLVAGQTARLDFNEPGGGVTIAVSFIDARGEPVLMMGVLVPGVVPTPGSFEAWRELMKRGQRVLPLGRESPATPGEATLVAMAMAMNSDQMFVFTERLLVTSAPRQSFTVRVPTTLTELKRPKR